MSVKVLDAQNNEYNLQKTVAIEGYDVRITKNHPWNVETEGGSKTYHRFIPSAVRNWKADKGLVDFGKLMTGIPLLINGVGVFFELMDPFAPFDVLAKQFDRSWKGLCTFQRTVTMASESFGDVMGAGGAIVDMTIDCPTRTRKILKGVKAGADATSMACYSAAAIAALTKGTQKFMKNCFSVATVGTAVYDATSLTLNLDKLRVISKLDVSKADEGSSIRTAVEQSKRNIFLGTLKDVVAVASDFFALLLMFAGVSVLPALVALTMSVAGAVLGTAQHIQEEMSTFEVINPFKDVRSYV